MSIPGQILFIFVADYMHMSTSTIGWAFVTSYLSVSLLQVKYLFYDNKMKWKIRAIATLMQNEKKKMYFIV